MRAWTRREAFYWLCLARHFTLFTLSAASSTSYNERFVDDFEVPEDPGLAPLAPLDLGVRLNGSSGMLTLISEVHPNPVHPLRGASVLKVHCRDMEDKLEFPLLAKAGALTFVLHKIRLPCPRGVKAKVKQSIEVNHDGVWFSLADDGEAGETSRLLTSTLHEHVVTQGELLAISVSLASASESQLHKVLHVLRLRRKNETMTDLAACWKEHKALQDRVVEAKLASAQWQSKAETKESEFKQLSQRAKELQRNLKALKQKDSSRRDQSEEKQALETMLQMKSTELEHRRREALWWSVASSVVAGSSALAFFTWKRYDRTDDLSLDAKKERRKLLRLLGRVKAQSDNSDASLATATPATEGSPEKLETNDPSNSSNDPKPGDDQLFPYTVESECRRGRDAKRLRIQCPGVQEADVTIKVLFNGAEVYIDREEAPGLPAVSWKHRFIFPSEEGHVVFADDETKLSHGLLELLFFCQDFVTRTFRFPEHFDLAYDD